jgi:DNA-binding PadR family transcriptional regulator
MGENAVAPPEGFRVTYQGLRVLRAFLAAHSENVRSRLAGADIMRIARLSSGTLYPLLVRFEKAGLIEGDWEAGDPKELGRPVRRLYRLTSAGVQLARQALETVSLGAVIAVREG